jgi:hypothetical protein
MPEGSGASRPRFPRQAAAEPAGHPAAEADEPGGNPGDNPGGAAGRHARRRRPRRTGPVTGLLLGAAGSTFTTAIAAGVAGFQADRVLEPVEFAIRVSLLLAAPCLGAFVATGFLPRFVARPPAWAVGIGAAAGPILVLRLDRVRVYGLGTTLAAAGVIAAWAAISAVIAASTRRPDHRDPGDRSDLPPPSPPHRPDTDPDAG